MLLYGERGVGKSSLANVVTALLMHLITRRIHVKRCDQSDTFESILKSPLAEVGADLTLVGVTDELEKTSGIKIAGVKGERAKSIVGTYEASHSLSPSTVAEAIGGMEGLLVVDEVDAVGNPEDRRKIAELIKLLSDSGSKFKIMVVGIAATGSELTAAHPSVQRCLKETKLERMSDSELRKIVNEGGIRAGLSFTPKVVSNIVRLSAGYPHFTHLMALKCAEEAVADERRDIRDIHLREALQLAVKDAEGSLKRDYEAATRSANSSTYKHIVQAAASAEGEEFTASSLRSEIEKITGQQVSQGSLANFLKRLVSDNGPSILRRAAKGVYKFSDPRMASYVRMVNSMVEE